jgi:hypothetical protein
MTWQMYMTMSNTELVHSLLNNHVSVCKCLECGEEEKCALWNLIDEIGRRLTESPREPFYETPEGPAN